VTARGRWVTLPWSKTVPHPRLGALLGRPRNLPTEHGVSLIVVLTATGIGSFATYLYQVVMARRLGPAEFGAFGALFAIFYIASVTGNALQASVAETVAHSKARDGRDEAVRIALGLAWLVALVAGAIAGSVALAHGLIAPFLGIPSSMAVIIVAGALFFALVQPVVVGLFAGLQRFVAFSLVGQIIPHVSKLVVGATLVFSGMGLLGAVAAMPISGGIAVVSGLVWIWFAYKAKPGLPRSVAAASAVSVKTLTLAMFLMVPANIDVLVVAHYFPRGDVGIYNALATLGKVIIFLPLPFALIILPVVADRHTHGDDAKGILLAAIAGTGILLGLPLLAYWVVPNQVVRFVVGESYLPAASFLGWYGIAMALFATNILLFYYSLGIQNTRYMIVAVSLSLGEVLSMSVFHDSFFQIISVLIAGNLLLFVYGLLELVAPAAHKARSSSYASSQSNRPR